MGPTTGPQTRTHTRDKNMSKTMRNHRRDRKPYKIVTDDGEGDVYASFSSLVEAQEALAAHPASVVKALGLCVCIALRTSEMFAIFAATPLRSRFAPLLATAAKAETTSRGRALPGQGRARSLRYVSIAPALPGTITTTRQARRICAPTIS